MSDFRVKYLKFLEDRPILISAVEVAGLSGITVPGLILEQNNGCAPIIQLWLIGALVRVWLRMFVLMYLIYRKDSSIDANAVRVAYMYKEGLDVIGLVWFMLMSIVVFNNNQCLEKSPLVYSACLSYLLPAYLYIGIYYSVIQSLARRPPTSPEDVEYLHCLWQSAIDLRNQLSNAPVEPPTPVVVIDPTGWSHWLESYGSYAITYEKTEQSASSLRDRANTQSTEHNLSMCSADSAEDIELGLNCPSLYSEPAVSTRQHQSLSQSALSSPSSVLFTTAQCTPQIQHALDTTEPEENPLPPSPETAHTVMDHTHINTESCAICLSNFIPKEDITGSSASQKDNHIIVRYPCPGNHYFHAHCLHRWLQADATRRSANNQRFLNAVAQGDCRNLVTCPVCRQRPTMNINAFKQTNRDSAGGDTN